MFSLLEPNQPLFTHCAATLAAIGMAIAAAPAALAQQCNCSCDYYIPPNLIVNKVLMNENGAGPLAHAGTNQTTLTKHANLFSDPGMTITHVCIALRSPTGTTGQPGQVIISWPDITSGNLPGAAVHVQNFIIDPQPNLLGQLHQIVEVNPPATVAGDFWVEVAYPTATANIPNQGIRPRTSGNSAVYLNLPGSQYHGWEYYDNTFTPGSPFGSALVGMAPVIRPLHLVPPPLVCPGTGIVENEPNCGIPNDVVNGGCNSATLLLTPLNCGDTVCGTAAWDPVANVRDLDWYSITLPYSTTVTWGVQADFDPQLTIAQPGPPGAECASISFIATHYGVANQPEEVSATIGPGEYWLIVAPVFTAAPVPCATDYIATVTCCGYGSTCPPGMTAEPESCGANVNGTCLPGAGQSPIICNQPVCGTAWADMGGRDTDWYELQVVDLNGDGWAMTFLTIDSELPVRLELHDNSCSSPFPITYTGGLAPPCTPTMIAAAVPAPGTYHIIVEPTVTSGYSCGTNNQYTLLVDTGVDCSTGCGPAPANDDCANAIPLTSALQTFDNTCATTDGPAELCGFTGQPNLDADVWFTFIAPPCSATRHMSLAAPGGGGRLLGVYTDCPQAGGTLIDCGAGPGSAAATVSFQTVAGQVYYVRAGGINGAQGISTLLIESCPGDFAPLPFGDCLVNVTDLLHVINNWGTYSVNHLLIVLNNWGACP